MIEAKIDHDQGFLSSQEVVDLYSTEEPQKAFHKYVILVFVLYYHILRFLSALSMF